MSWPFRDDFDLGDDVFIPIENAFTYLIEEKAVFELERLFFCYKGFVTEDWFDARFFFDRASNRVHIDAVVSIKDKDLRSFWQIYSSGTAESFTVEPVELYVGKINNKLASFTPYCRDHCNNFNLDPDVQIYITNVYVKKSDLDEISQKYGIAINPFWKDSFFKSTAESKDNTLNDNVVIDSVDSPQDLIINFIKLVLKKYPNAKTADLRRNCFEDIGSLKGSRKIEMINSLLIKAGAIKSSRGEHAKPIEWESKYPKAQWMRVFLEKEWY